MITVAYITARRFPRFDWFFDSLALQSGLGDVGQVVIVDRFAEACDSWTNGDVVSRNKEVASFQSKFQFPIRHVPPKPNVWSGKHRLTPRDWWSTACYRNTALCHATGDYIAYLDDRCVLEPTWLDAVREAREKQYAVCGTYEKRTEMVVTDGRITEPGKTIGVDGRAAVAQGRKMICPGTWVYGCTFGLPVEWMLNINGVDESWDSVSMEDTHFGQMIENNLYPIFHDPRMRMIEDRSGQTEHEMKRSSKEQHPHDKNDKTHKLIAKLWGNKRAVREWDLRQVREQVLKGGGFPVPTAPTHDWFDGQALSEMW